jgi:cysteinyl-tRNA synthetase
MQLHLYNTATRSKDPFEPLTPGLVRMYCCGPTVYHFAHIGNLRTYVFEDLLRRTLEFFSYEVRHIVNITDVGHLTSDADTGEDKMEKGARREGKSAWEIAEYYTQAFQKDWKALNLLEPTEWPRATQHIAEQIALIRELDGKGYAYSIPGDGVYFDTAKFPRYPDFARLDLEGLQAGARVAANEGKKSPTDFALWKFSTPETQRQMEWESPWGKGFPGWHIECSAMAMKILGDTLDIHCGGADHIRVHHTNEIAQSEAATGKPFSRFWMHGGWLLEAPDESAGKGGGKMSKSSGEFVTLDVLIHQGYSPMDYRYFCLTAHYRNYLNFSHAGLDSARDSLRNLRKRTDALIGKAVPVRSDKGQEWQARFLETICDDLNFPQALGILNLMLKDADVLEGEKASLVAEWDRLLGLGLTVAEKSEIPDLPEDMMPLLAERTEARKRKDWARSDALRDQFRARGFVLKDNPDGSVGWEKISIV